MVLCSKLSVWSHPIMNNNLDIYYYGDYVLYTSVLLYSYINGVSGFFELYYPDS